MRARFAGVKEVGVWKRGGPEMAVNGGNKQMQIISWKRRLELASYRSHTCNPAICVRLYFSPGYHPSTLIVAQQCSRDFTSILHAEAVS